MPVPNNLIRLVFLLVFTLIFISSSFATEKMQYIVGAGPSTKIVQLFAEEFVKTDEASHYQFEVPEYSIKHKGGIGASNNFIFGRTGRPLNEEEKAMNKEEIILAEIPISFASGLGVTVDKLSLDQLKGIYAGKITNWNEVGGPDGKIALIGRESTEAVLSVLVKTLPSLMSADYLLVAKKDHQIVSYLKSTRGKFCLGFGSKQILSDLNVIEVDGINVGIRVGLVYDLKNKSHPIVLAAKIFVKSEQWRKVVARSGGIPPS